MAPVVKSYFSCLLTMQEFPSYAKNIVFIPRSEGPETTVVSLTHTHTHTHPSSVYLEVCLLRKVFCHVSA